MNRPELNTPEYKKWRLDVYKRDKFRCVLCKDSKLLNAHHIKRWSDYPELRYAVENGCTLCKKHHTLVTGNEEAYEQQLTEIVRKDAKYDKHDIAKMLKK